MLLKDPTNVNQKLILYSISYALFGAELFIYSFGLDQQKLIKSVDTDDFNYSIYSDEENPENIFVINDKGLHTACLKINPILKNKDNIKLETQLVYKIANCIKFHKTNKSYVVKISGKYFFLSDLN